MNLYFVRTKDEREWHEPILDDGTGPYEAYWPMGIYAAESYGQAKYDFLHDNASNPRTGVYSDDYPNLRCALLAHDVSFERGELKSSYGWDQYSNLIELAMKQGYWCPEPCYLCGKWVGKDGVWHEEYWEYTNIVSSMDAECARCHELANSGK